MWACVELISRLYISNRSVTIAEGEVPWKKQDDFGEGHERNKHSALGIIGGFLYVFKHVHSLHTMIKCSYIQDNAA